QILSALGRNPLRQHLTSLDGTERRATGKGGENSREVAVSQGCGARRPEPLTCFLKCLAVAVDHAFEPYGDVAEPDRCCGRAPSALGGDAILSIEHREADRQVSG